MIFKQYLKEAYIREDTCEKLFGEVLFGEFKQFYKQGERESNTEYETKVWLKVHGWVRGEYMGRKRDAALSKAVDALMKCKGDYPRVLKGKGKLLYRGFRRWNTGETGFSGKYIEKQLDKVKKMKPGRFKTEQIGGSLYYVSPWTYQPESKFQSWSIYLLSKYIGDADQGGGFAIRAKVPDAETIFSSVFLNALSRSFKYGSEGEVLRVGDSIKGEILIPENTFWKLFPAIKPNWDDPWKRDEKLVWPDAPELRGRRTVTYHFLDTDETPPVAVVSMPGRKPKKGGKRYKEKTIRIPISKLLKHNKPSRKGINPSDWDKNRWGN